MSINDALILVNITVGFELIDIVLLLNKVEYTEQYTREASNHDAILKIQFSAGGYHPK